MSRETKDPWRVVVLDIETCPEERPRTLRNGYCPPDVNNAKIVSYAFCDLLGNMVVRDTAVNPQVRWEHIRGYTNYVEKAWGIGAGELEQEARCLPTFPESVMGSIATLRKCVGKNLILAAHNGHCWDFPIWEREMRKAGKKFPPDMRIMTFDTQYITKFLMKSFDKKDKKWNLAHAIEVLFGEKNKPGMHTAGADVQELRRIICYWARTLARNVHVTDTEIAAMVTRERYGLHQYGMSSLESRLLEVQAERQKEEEHKQPIKDKDKEKTPEPTATGARKLLVDLESV